MTLPLLIRPTTTELRQVGRCQPAHLIGTTIDALPG